MGHIYQNHLIFCHQPQGYWPPCSPLCKQCCRQHAHLAYHRYDPVEWDKLTDLKGVPSGTLRGYLNSVEFDRLAAENILTVRPVATDNINLLKLAAHRLRLAVVDLYDLHYLLETDPDLVEERKKDKKGPHC
ncbi:hypothetical protein [Paremcibacter congregatus]|uniref:hypothetical protein n=1 Tax=Paremcibacter congregatus TaxID=2043170 RepID=UPI0030EEF793